MTQGYCK